MEAAGAGGFADEAGGDHALNGFVGGAIEDFELHRRQRIGFARAEQFGVQ
jgi:hypothetical protein